MMPLLLSDAARFCTKPILASRQGLGEDLRLSQVAAFIDNKLLLSVIINNVFAHSATKSEGRISSATSLLVFEITTQTLSPSPTLTGVDLSPLARTPTAHPSPYTRRHLLCQPPDTRKVRSEVAFKQSTEPPGRCGTAILSSYERNPFVCFSRHGRVTSR